MALICLSFVALHHLQNIRPVARKALWIFLVVTATWGPVVELASVGFRNFVASAHVDPIGRRLNLLVDIRGPFLFRSLLFDPDSAAPLEAPGFLVGGARRRQGLALYSRPFPLRAGRYHVAYQVHPTQPMTAIAPLMDLGVTINDSQVVVARRSVQAGDLEQRGDSLWGGLDFRLLENAKDVQFRLSNTSEIAFEVTDMHLDRP